MSRNLVETITDFFKPQAPLWACEITSKRVVVAGVNSSRNKVEDKFATELRRGGHSEDFRQAVSQLFSEVQFKGSEIAVVVPDETARIALLTAENPSKNADEQETFIRWKLKKSVPFDVDTAQVAYRFLGPHRSGTGIDILVALSPRSVVEQYESLFADLEIHAGIVLPSTLAALNLFAVPPADTLFVKVAPDCVTTTVFQNRRVQFYRRITGVSLYDAVYPTVLYYQDKLGGQAFERLYFCGYHESLQPELREIREKLGLAAQPLEPTTVEDVYKPALGAVHLKPKAVA